MDSVLKRLALSILKSTLLTGLKLILEVYSLVFVFEFILIGYLWIEYRGLERWILSVFLMGILGISYVSSF